MADRVDAIKEAPYGALLNLEHPHAAMVENPYRVLATIAATVDNASFQAIILVACPSQTILNRTVTAALGNGWTVTKWDVA
jgi:hypothetical protein